jgi:large subunit ribosomal protein L29
MKRKEELERLNEMSVEELQEEADRLKESLFRLKFRHALSDMEAVKDIRREKRTLARINTFIQQREAKQTQTA